MSIDAETLAGWKRDAGTIRPQQFGKTIAGRILALIAENAELRKCFGVAEMDRVTAERDALQAQVDAVKAIYFPHRASLPAGFEDACVCLGCNMARALGETGDES